MQLSESSKEAYIFVTIYSLQKRLEQILFEYISKYNITVPQARVMNEIAQNPGVSVKELTIRLPLSQSTISGVIDRLEKKNLVIKQNNPLDKRSVVLKVSENTQRFLSSNLNNFYTDVLKEYLQSLSDDEKTSVVRGLSALEKCLH